MQTASKSFIVAAIDFGTTYSGTAFSFKHHFEKDPTKVITKQWIGNKLISLKGPTSVLITNDGESVDCFGSDAESKYGDLASEKKHTDWYFFRRFKMMLYGDINVRKDILLKDETGKELSALKVFSMCIQFLKDDLLEMANTKVANTVVNTDILWVLTVPAIWNDTAKRFMRKAAEKAGIDPQRLTIALEPEAASLYCLNIPLENCLEEQTSSLTKFKAGSKYLVLDAGGGTVDVTVQEIDGSGDIKELYQASGGAWGGTKVDLAFEKLLLDIFGDDTIKQLKEESMDDYFRILENFEIKKREVSSKTKGKVIFVVPYSLLNHHNIVTEKGNDASIASTKYGDKIGIFGDKLKIEADIIRGLFEPTVTSIVRHLEILLDHPSVRGCEIILMVGGFSEAPLLQEQVRTSFQSMKVIVPADAGLAVLKGAVIFGHNPAAITERVCKYAYGTKSTHVTDDNCSHRPGQIIFDANGKVRCDNLFDIHVRKGQVVKLGAKQEEKIVSSIHDEDTFILQHIYASTEENPVFVTDKGCQKIGQFAIPITGGAQGKVGISFMFGGTEIEVIAEDKTDNKQTKHRVEFLG